MDMRDRQLLEEIERTIGLEAQLKDEDTDAPTAVFEAGEGSTPITVRFEKGEDIRAAAGKTPRYYPREEIFTEKLVEDLSDYVSGRTARIDFVSRNGEESKMDRMVKSGEAAGLDEDALRSLTTKVGLLHGDEFPNLLASGGAIRVRFWDTSRDFAYRYKNGVFTCEKQ